MKTSIVAEARTVVTLLLGVACCQCLQSRASITLLPGGGVSAFSANQGRGPGPSSVLNTGIVSPGSGSAHANDPLGPAPGWNEMPGTATASADYTLTVLGDSLDFRANANVFIEDPLNPQGRVPSTLAVGYASLRFVTTQPVTFHVTGLSHGTVSGDTALYSGGVHLDGDNWWPYFGRFRDTVQEVPVAGSFQHLIDGEFDFDPNYLTYVPRLSSTGVLMPGEHLFVFELQLQSLSWNVTPNAVGSAGGWAELSLTPIPEPSTFIAGALALLPLGGSMIRLLRTKRAA